MVLACIRPASNCHTAFLQSNIRIARIAGNCITRDLLLFAGVGLRITITADRYSRLRCLRDRQQTIRAIHNNVIVINALFTNGAFNESHIILSGIDAFTVRRNSFEFSSGFICLIAINRFQLAVIGLVAAVGLECYILVQFENNYIRRFIRSNCDTLGFIALQRITLRSGGRYSNLIPESLSGMHSAVNHLIVPLVHHSIGQVAARAPASGKGNVMIRHCKEAVFIDFNSSCGPTAEDIACKLRSTCNLYRAFNLLRCSRVCLRCARGDGPGITVGYLMGVALIVQGDDVAFNANGQGIFRRCGNPCIAGDILFVLRHRNLAVEGLTVVGYGILHICVRILIQIPHRIAQVRPLCPDRVQVCAIIGNKEGISSKVACHAIRGSGPAGEGVAVRGGEADICRRFHLCEVITTDTVFGANLRTIMVNKCNPGRCLGVAGDEDHIAGHLHGLTGLIDLAVLAVCFVLPVEEPHIAVDGTQDRGTAAALVVVVVNRARLTILLYIGNLKGFQRSGEVGNQGYISKELSIRVEQLLSTVAVYGEPGAGLAAAVAGFDLFHQFRITGGILQRGAVGNAQRYLRTADFNRQINGCFDLGGRPLGIEGDGLGRHGLAIEYESIALTGLVIIPTSKLVTRRHTGRPGGFIAHAAQRLLKLHGLRLFRSTVVDEDNVVAVAGVVELGIAIGFTVLGTTFVGETSNVILIFLRNLIPGSGRNIAVVFLVSDTMVCCTSLSREHLYVIVCCFGAIGRFRSVEALAVKGHNINIYLISNLRARILFRTPCAAAIDLGPLVRNILTILRSNFQLIDR